MIADDWSHGHFGAYGCTGIQTPNFNWQRNEAINVYPDLRVGSTGKGWDPGDYKSIGCE